MNRAMFESNFFHHSIPFGTLVFCGPSWEKRMYNEYIHGVPLENIEPPVWKAKIEIW